MTRVGLVGARGYVGRELISLLSGHPLFELAVVSSRELVGQAVSTQQDPINSDLHYIEITPDNIAEHALDAWILALPNGMAKPFVAAINSVSSNTVIIDLSADYRFDSEWYYGLPELTRAQYRGQKRISNPGCYATAIQLAIAPMLSELIDPVQCFGVSGYSGAGTSPSDRNNPHLLRDNLMPYALTGHLHEREVSSRLNSVIEFMPCVGAHFRGITLTVNMHLKREYSLDEANAVYFEFYRDEPLIKLQNDAPWVNRIAGNHGADIGGITLSKDGRRLVLVATLDNLLKGAATQAMQNLNIAFSNSETLGIPLEAALVDTIDG